MSKEKGECNCEGGHHKSNNANASGGALYGMGFVGALVYFVGQATTFWLGALGVLKAIVWPAILVYKLLEMLR